VKKYPRMGKKTVILAVSYLVLFIFLSAYLSTSQPIIAFLFAGIVAVWFFYCYKFDNEEKPREYWLKRPLAPLSMMILTFIFLLSFPFYNTYNHVTGHESLPEIILFLMFMILPCFFYVIFLESHHTKALTREDYMEPYEEEMIIPLNYAKAFDISMQSIQPFTGFQIYTADRISGIIRAGDYRKTLSPCSGMIVVTITVEKIVIGSTRIKIHGINPEPFIKREKLQRLNGHNEWTVKTIAGYIREKAADPKDKPAITKPVMQDPILFQEVDTVKKTEDDVPDIRL